MDFCLHQWQIKIKWFLAIRLRRRTQEDVDKPALRRTKDPLLVRSNYTSVPKKSTTQLIMDMADRISPEVGPYIVTDSLYGSLELLFAAKARGIGSFLKCRADRPTWIFSTLKRIVHNLGDLRVGAYATMSGEINGVSFTAFSINLKIKSNNTATWAHLLSTQHQHDQISINDINVTQVEEKDTTISLEAAGNTFGGFESMQPSGTIN
jgi:hypothetical protein